jgi:Ca-activated chloride channel family protein
MLVLSTVAAVLAPQLARSGSGSGGNPPVPMPVPPAVVAQDTNGVHLAGTLSQAKLLQGRQGTVYLDLAIRTPTVASTSTVYRPSDIVVVLDRSGSMAADNKLPYAKEAVRQVVSRLQATDRFALVTFDAQAAVTTALTPVTPEVREQIAGQLDSMRPGDATNISAGLITARQLLADLAAERSRRVILLSDGEANRGLVDAKELGQIAASFSQYEAVLSTIGMGLGFNETVMASLADYGMGHYAYLEHLATLGDILAQDLHQAQQVYASASGVEITLGPGITITDAGGYPLDLTSQPGTARILTGQLLAGMQKHFVVTLQVPTTHLGEVQLGAVTLHYSTHDGDSRIALAAADLQVAILEPSRQEEAVASIDQGLYRQVWQGNNLGRLQKELSHWLRRGDQKKAAAAIATYRDELQKTEAASGVVIRTPEVAQKLSTLDKDVNEAFAGPAPQQERKRNRAAKEQHQEALRQQRSY